MQFDLAMVSAAFAAAAAGATELRYGNNVVPENFRASHISNCDTNRRVIVRHPISLEAGKMYLLEADVTIPGRLTGPDGKGATAFLEYADANGKWLGGTYLEEQRFTDGRARRVKAVSSPIRKEAVSITLGMGISKGCRGEAFFENLSARELALPPPEKSSYRYDDVRCGEGARVWIDGRGRTVVDGKRFFPLGVYGGIATNDVVRFRGGPFNTLMLYAAPGLAELDRAADNGLKVIAGVNHYFAGRKDTAKSVKSVADEEPQLARYMRTVKDHPALLAWYSFDELPITMLTQLMGRRAFLEREDPGHPVWAVMNNWELTEYYLGAFDVAGCDPYPIPDKPISHVADAVRDQRVRSAGRRAIWAVPQIFSWGNYSREGGRPPTRAEVRNMTWQAIAEGAGGIIYFRYGDLYKNRDGKTTFESRWKDLTSVADEVSRFIPVMLGDGPLMEVKGQTAVVRARAFSHAGEVHLVAVNASREKAAAAFEVCGDGNRVPYAAELEPLEVRMLNLSEAFRR